MNLLQASLKVPTDRKMRASDIKQLVDVAKADGKVSFAEKSIIGDTVLQAKDGQGLTKHAADYYKDLVEKDGFFKLKDIRDSINGGP